MQKVGVNDPCPCESGKKYKKCYLKQDSDCSFFVKEKDKKQKEEYETSLKEVIDTLLSITGELNRLFYKTDANEEVIPSRMQLIGIFTIIDVLGSYWYEYLGKTGKQSERFDEFITKFCFLDQNPEFKNKKYLSSVEAVDLRELRNNIVHFYGLGKNSKGHSYCVMPNPCKQTPQEMIDEDIVFFKKISNNLIFIQPIELKRIIYEGAILMIDEFNRDSSSANTFKAHMEGIERIRLKLKEEGGKYLNKNTVDSLKQKLS